MRDLLQEKDRTREAVSQIVSWCLVIALHQTEGIGKKRQDDVAAKALVIQEAAAKRLARQSREEVIAWLRSKLDRLDLPDGALTFRVPLRRAPKSRREQELRIAGDQAATLTWLIFALAIHRALHFGHSGLYVCIPPRWKTTVSSQIGSLTVPIGHFHACSTVPNRPCKKNWIL